MKWNVIRHLGVVLGAVALATMLWGCSNMAPTSPTDPSLQPAGNSTFHTEAEPDQWW
jgi:hypothetical protein